MTDTKADISILDNGNLSITAPLQIRYHLGRKLVIVPGTIEGKSPEAEPPVHEFLIEMVARGHAWMKMIEEGIITCLQELIDKTGYHRTHIARILQVANLSPELTETILNGREPGGLSMTKLKKPIPENWPEQRDAFV